MRIPKFPTSAFWFWIFERLCMVTAALFLTPWKDVRGGAAVCAAAAFVWAVRKAFAERMTLPVADIHVNVHPDNVRTVVKFVPPADAARAGAREDVAGRSAAGQREAKADPDEGGGTPK